jgi:hypothetical protein
MARFEAGIPGKWAACTPSDTTDITGSIGLRIGGAGNVAFRCIDDPANTITIPAAAGEYIPGNFTRIMAATTATGIHIAFA